jgi:hypothetical protein
MDLGEKVLYHQIHPAKLAADVSGSLVSTYLMWRRRFAWAKIAAFVPAVVASVLVMAYADPERTKHSPFGRYMQRYMEPAGGGVALLRASGDMGWRMVPSRQAHTHRVGHSRCGLGLRALA